MWKKNKVETNVYRLSCRTMRYQVLGADGCWKDIFLVSEADSEFYSFSESLLQAYDFTNKETELKVVGNFVQCHTVLGENPRF